MRVSKSNAFKASQTLLYVIKPKMVALNSKWTTSEKIRP
jgi:hypothetical protein